MISTEYYTRKEGEKLNWSDHAAEFRYVPTFQGEKKVDRLDPLEILWDDTIYNKDTECRYQLVRNESFYFLINGWTECKSYDSSDSDTIIIYVANSLDDIVKYGMNESIRNKYILHKYLAALYLLNI